MQYERTMEMIMGALDWQRFPSPDDMKAAHDEGFRSKGKGNPYVYGTTLWQQFENGRSLARRSKSLSRRRKGGGGMTHGW